MNLMLVGRSRMFVDIAAKLVEDDRVQITSFVTSITPEIVTNEKFKSIQLIDREQFIHPENVYRLNLRTNFCLSGWLTKKFAECENEFMAISDRWCFGLAVWERKRIYHELLLYWYDYLRSDTVQAILFQHVPHGGWDNILYRVAETLGVRTLIRQWTLINDRMLLLERYDSTEKVPLNYLSAQTKCQVVCRIEKDLHEVLKKPSANLRQSSQLIERTLNQGATRRCGWEFVIRIIYGFVKMVINRTRKAYDKKRADRLLPMNERQNEIKIEALRYRYKVKLSKLRKYYSRKASEVDYNCRYVFFALHCQPEATTSPLGGCFQDQLLAIRILSAVLPDDWVVYVKEHPFQFAGGMVSKLHREKMTYDHLNDLKNVRLVRLEEDSEKLIEQSVCTSTITGSIGWQSLLKKRSCIVFGVPWYAGCNSCYMVNSSEEGEAAIRKIRKNTEDNVELDVWKFLAYYQNKFIVSVFDHADAVQSSLDYDTVVNNQVNGIAERVNTAMLSIDERKVVKYKHNNVFCL